MPKTRHAVPVLLAYAVSGVAALVYEVAWMRELSTMLGSTAYASGTMLSAYMTGLGLGTLLGVWVAKRVKHPLRAASRAELAVAGFSLVALLGLRGTYFDLMKQLGLSGSSLLALQFAASFFVMLLPTIAMGATYPLVIEAVGRRDMLGKWAGNLYSVNTGGAIVGSLLAGFVLIPTFGVKGALFTAAACSCIAATIFAVLAMRASGAPALWRSPEALIMPATLAIILLIPAPTGSPLGLGQIYYFNSSAEYQMTAAARKQLYESEGIYSRVTVVENGKGVKTLSNGALDEGTNNDIDRTTTSLLALTPASSAASTDTALVVGLGTGYTSLAYHRLGFGHVTTVEINPSVVGASKEFIGPIPENDPSWNLVIDDARSYILTNPAKYDAITSEPSWPWSSGVAALFTREFVTAAKSRLNPGGVYAQWLPNYILKPADVKMMYKTMRSVYPRVDVWAINFPGDPVSELLLIGHIDAAGRSVPDIAKRIESLRPILAAKNKMMTPQSITPYPDMASLQRAVSDPSVPLNTDDHSTLEYRVFWNFFDNAEMRAR
jgi:spermidine synthase